MRIAPGEPVPPGFEDEVKPIAEIQPELDKCTTTALVGIEYIMELTKKSGDGPNYRCVLCDTSYYRNYESGAIMIHLLSDNHRMAFLDRHFTTAMNELFEYRFHKMSSNIVPSIIDAICTAIEDTYGRLPPNIYDSADYAINREKYTQKVMSENHFDEKFGLIFTDLIDHKAIRGELKKGKKKRSRSPMKTSVVPSTSFTFGAKKAKCDSSTNADLEVISIASSESAPSRENSPIMQIEQPKIDEKKYAFSTICKSFSKSLIRYKSKSPIRPAEYTESRKDSNKDRVLQQKYRSMVEAAEWELEKLLDQYENHPHTHPKYPEEWKKFWKLRSDELRLDGMDPFKYDFSPEWTKFWIHRVKELHDEALQQKRIQIQKKLNLSSDFRSQPDSSYYNSKERNVYLPHENVPIVSYEPESSTKEEVEDVEDSDEDDVTHMTLISVLRILTAFEEYLGSLGPKVVDLLSKAIALEKVKANLADELLMSAENNVLLETSKEKLVGQIVTGVIDKHKIKGVKKAIRNVSSLVKLMDKKAPNIDIPFKPRTITQSITNTVSSVERERATITNQISAAFHVQGKVVTNTQLENLTNIYLTKNLCNDSNIFGLLTESLQTYEESTSNNNSFNQNRSQQNKPEMTLYPVPSTHSNQFQQRSSYQNRDSHLMQNETRFSANSNTPNNNSNFKLGFRKSQNFNDDSFFSGNMGSNKTFSQSNNFQPQHQQKQHVNRNQNVESAFQTNAQMISTPKLSSRNTWSSSINQESNSKPHKSDISSLLQIPQNNFADLQQMRQQLQNKFSKQFEMKIPKGNQLEKNINPFSLHLINSQKLQNQSRQQNQGLHNHGQKQNEGQQRYQTEQYIQDYDQNKGQLQNVEQAQNQGLQQQNQGQQQNHGRQFNQGRQQNWFPQQNNRHQSNQRNNFQLQNRQQQNRQQQNQSQQNRAQQNFNQRQKNKFSRNDIKFNNKF